MGHWNRKITPVNGAFFDIWAFVIKLLAGFWLTANLGAIRQVTEAHKIARRKQQAVWIRSTLLVGANLHQNGQLFSTRAVISQRIRRAPEATGQVPAFSYEQVETIVEQELGRRFKTIQIFDPLAAASLGQVQSPTAFR